MTTQVQDLELNGTIAHDRRIRCVFKLPPGVVMADGSNEEELEELGEGNFFTDSSRQYRLSTIVARGGGGASRRRLVAVPVPDGYWAVTGFDLGGAASIVPGLPGEAAAPFYRLAPFPHEEGKGHDSRRCYYLNKGVPSVYPGAAPATFGAPYAAPGMYLEITDVQKVVHVYGMDGECESGAVGYWAYDEGSLRGVPLMRFMYVAVSDVFRPRAGDFVPVPAQIYRLPDDNTYWAPLPPRHGQEYNGIFMKLP